MDFEQDIWDTFRAESTELLERFETLLLELENAASIDPDSVHALFRVAHTLKGTAGMAEFHDVVAFAHIVESLLNEVRENRLKLESAMIATLITCRDHLAALFEGAYERREPDDRMRATDAALRAELESFLPEELSPGSESMEEPAVSGTRGPNANSEHWHISLRFGSNVFRNGLDPIPLLLYLKELGSIVRLVTVTAGLPATDDVDPESCYLGCDIRFDSSRTAAEIDGAFEFVRHDCLVRILPPGSPLADFAALADELPESFERIKPIWRELGVLTPVEIDGLVSATVASATQDPLGDLELTARELSSFDVKAGSPEPMQSSARGASGRGASFLRIESGKLDYLINLVGELAISAVSLNQAAARSGDSDVLEQATVMNRLIGEARDSALKLRMVQVGETFRRFRRYVREVGRELDKDIRLLISGGDTELDKTVVEKIEEPLSHIIRNAIDHGIESSADRLAAGKPAEGSLYLRAYHETGSIVIEIADDGDGIDRQRVLAHAVERGLVHSEARLSDEEVHALLFEPGFSTAAEVTNISGRGVGLDVVREAIEGLRGNVSVRSQKGQGTTFVIRLPLTLAIIDGFLVRVGDSSCVVPLEQMVECVGISAVDRVDQRRNIINLRGEVLPFIDLGETFGSDPARERHENVVVVRYGDLRCGLLVDDLLGEFQAIIKPLGKIFDRLRGISGMSVMGDGSVAFILDIPALAHQASREETRLQRVRTPGGSVR